MSSMFALDAINTVRFKGRYPLFPIKGFDVRFKSAGRSETQQPQVSQFLNDFKPAIPGEGSNVIYQLDDAFRTDFKDFSNLVKKERYQFQDWAVQQIGMIPNSKKSRDGGIDGEAELRDDPYDAYSKVALTQVKSNSRNWRADVERFCYTLDKKSAACGVFITLNPIGRRSLVHKIAVEQGNITVGSSVYPRLQLWSIKEFYEDSILPNLPPLVSSHEN